jgi:hypothetical protein
MTNLSFRRVIRPCSGARDVFDLHLLLTGSADVEASRLDAALRATAIERALSVDFGMFKSQVLAYLPVEHQAAYNSKRTWEQMVLLVVDSLDASAPSS